MDFNKLELIGLAFLSGVNIAEEVKRLEDEEQNELESIKSPECGECGEHKVEETKFEVGNTVKLIELGTATQGFEVGDICTITRHYNCMDINSPDDVEFEIYKKEDLGFTCGYVNAYQIEKINESEEN